MEGDIVGKFFKFLIKIWNSQCNATKILTILGFMGLSHTCISVFTRNSFSSPSSLAVRSIVSSIFGYLFGEQLIPNDNFSNKKFQIAISSIIAVITLVITILSDWIGIDQNNAALVEIRSLLFSSVGFLISRCKSSDCTKKLDNT